MFLHLSFFNLKLPLFYAIGGEGTWSDFNISYLIMAISVKFYLSCISFWVLYSFELCWVLFLFFFTGSALEPIILLLLLLLIFCYIFNWTHQWTLKIKHYVLRGMYTYFCILLLVLRAKLLSPFFLMVQRNVLKEMKSSEDRLYIVS